MPRPWLSCLPCAALLAATLVGCATPRRPPRLGRRPEDPLTRPTIIVPHPTRGIVQGLMHLRLRRQLPDAHYIFLTHKHQRYDFDNLAPYLRQRGFRSFEIVELHGLPISRAFEKEVAGNPQRHPDAWVLRVRLTPTPYLPPEWRRIFQDIASRADGVIIPGGGSIPAPFYRANQYAEHLSSQPVRAVFELSFLRFLLDGPDAYLVKRPRFLVLGICHGHQAINVALGGSLYQSIPLEIYGQKHVREILDGDPDSMHRNYHLALYPTVGEIYMGWFHSIRVTGRSRFFKPLKQAFVLSNHHQAVRHLGRDLRVVAVSADGRVVEGVQHRWFPHVVGIQAHPEYRFTWQRLQHFGPDAVAFHHHLWRQVREVLLENHRARIRKAAPRLVPMPAPPRAGYRPAAPR